MTRPPLYHTSHFPHNRLKPSISLRFSIPIEYLILFFFFFFLETFTCRLCGRPAVTGRSRPISGCSLSLTPDLQTLFSLPTSTPSTSTLVLLSISNGFIDYCCCSSELTSVNPVSITTYIDQVGAGVATPRLLSLPYATISSNGVIRPPPTLGPGFLSLICQSNSELPWTLRPLRYVGFWELI